MADAVAYSMDFVDPEYSPATAYNLDFVDPEDDKQTQSTVSVSEPTADSSLTPYSVDTEEPPVDTSLSPYSIDTTEETQRTNSHEASPTKPKEEILDKILTEVKLEVPQAKKRCKLQPGRTKSETASQYKLKSEQPEEPMSSGYKPSNIPTMKRTASLTSLITKSDPSALFRSVFDPENNTIQNDSYDGAQPRNWNNEFQCLLDKELTRERTVALRDLAHDFVHASKKYGKIIIAEKNLPDEMKTIKRLGDSGGSAGGIKYVHHGIFFKFATDWKNLYGGDNYAMKSASHELKSLMRFYGSSTLRVPLMCIIDYHGYRLVAMSILPLKELLYGSGDAGAHIKADPGVHSLMGEVCKRINIAEHRAGAPQIPLYGPCDIEVHKGFDNRLYVLDFARLFPPTKPVRGKPGSHLFYLFRPEFCKKYSVPLSSDAYSRMGRADKAYHNKNCNEATELLFHTCAEVAMELDTVQKRPFQLKEIMQTIHAAGINFRFIGLVRKHVTDPELRILLFIEMVGRIIKRELWYTVRQRTTYLSEETLRAMFCNFLNQIVLSKDVEGGNVFWLRTLPSMLQEQYDYGSGTYAEDMFTENDIDSYRLLSTIDLLVLFQRLEDNMRISFTNSAKRSLAEDQLAFELVYCDIKRVGAKVRTTNLLLLAEGSDLHEQMNEREGAPSTRLFALALKSYTRAMNATPDDENVGKQYATLLFDFSVKQFNKVGIRAMKAKEHSPLALCKQIYAILTKMSNCELLYSMAKKLHSLIIPYTDSIEAQYFPELESLISIVCNFYSFVQKHEADKWETASQIGDLYTRLCNTAFRVHEIEKGTSVYERGGAQYRKALSSEPQLKQLMKSHLDWVMPLTDVELAQVVRLALQDEHLSIISSQDCPFLSDTLLETISKNVKQIRIVQLHESPITCTFTVQSIGTILKMHASSLEEIRLATPMLLDRIFSQCNKLERLTVHKTQDRSMKDLKSLPSLTSLDLSWTVASDRSLSSLLRKLKNLKEINLESAKIKGKSIKYFSAEMKVVSLKACSTLEGKYIKFLAQSCPSLEELCVSECNLTDSSASAIANCVKLVSLNLSSNQNITSAALKEIAMNCKSIQKLELAGLARAVNNELCALVSENMPNLTSLNLNSCYNITDESLVSLKQCKRLTRLSLVDARNITNSGIKAIASLPLEYLCIDFCQQITDGILSLKRCQNLSELSLRSLTRLTDEHILAFFADQRQCNIEKMDLTSCFTLSKTLIDHIQHRYPSMVLAI